MRLASPLSQAADTTYEPYEIPLRDFVYSSDGKAIRFGVTRMNFWLCDLTTNASTGPDSTPNAKASEVKSPDGSGWRASAAAT